MTVDDVFFHALQIKDVIGRAEYLDKACADNPQLRARVESLLAAHEGAASFLESPAAKLPIDPPPTATFAPPKPITERVGTIIGRYKLLQQIGEGGMGVVYMAEQEKPVRRRVALKIIKPGMDSAQVIARFEAERQALAMMDHPNIAKVLDAGTTDTGRPYFVMELVQGIPITQYCDDRQLTTRERLELFIQVCNAIQHAHQKGIIHRDLKPSNILIAIYDGKPVPKIIDFGVAKALHQQLTEKTMFTQFGAVVGTLEYMSPEQADMDLMGTDTCSDIYSLGVLLYELLTGSTPLDGKKLRSLGYAEMLKTIREVEPPKPSTRLSQSREEMGAISARRHTEPKRLQKMIAGDLDWIVMKCLEKDRARRYETAIGLAADIQRHLQDEAVSASPPGNLYKLKKLVRRNKVAFAAISCVIGALILGTVVSTWQAVQATRANHEASVARELAESNERKAVDAQAQEAIQRQKAERLAVENESNYQTARLNLYAADMAAASQAIDQSNFARARQLLAGQRPKSGESDLRGIEWRYLWALSRGDPIYTLDAGKVVRSVDVSPDGKLIAAACQAGTIQLWDSASLRQIASFGSQHTSNWGVAFAPTGHVLASCGDQSVDLGDTSLRRLTKEIDVRGPRPYYVAFSPDASLLAVGAGDARGTDVSAGQTILYDASTGEKLIALPDSGGRAMTFSPDGKLLATGPWHGVTRIWDVASRRIVQTLETKGYQSTQFSADGGTLFTAGANGLRRWNLADGARLQLLSSAADFQILKLSPDGKLLACGRRDGTIELWTAREGKLAGVLRGHEASVDGLAFTPDGTMLVSGSPDRTIRIWRLTPSTAPRPQSTSVVTLQRFEHGPCVRFSADDKWLAVHDGNGEKSRIMIVDVGQGRVFASLPTLALPVGFFPDGNTLLALDITQTDLNGRAFTSPGVRPIGKPHPGHIELWDWKTRTDRAVPLRNVPPNGVTAYAMSPDGNELALTLASPDKDSRILYSANSLTGECVLLNLPLGATAVGGLTFSPDGHYLAVGDVLRTLLCRWPGIPSFAVLPDQTGIALKPLFSRDGARLATGNTTGEIPTWDMPSGKFLFLLNGQGQAMFSASFSADNLTLASDAGSAVRLWHLATRRELMSFSNTASIEFSPDGQFIARVGIPANDKPFAYPLSLAHLPTLNEIDNPRPQTLAEAAKSPSGMFQPVIDEEEPDR